MEQFPLTLFLAVFVLVGAGLTAAGGVSVLAWFRLHRSTTSDVYSITDDGPVEVSGTARPTEEGRTIVAPLTGTETLCYRYTVERYDRDDEGSDWETVEESEGRVPFLVADDSGTVRVEPDGAKLLLAEAYRSRFGPDADLPTTLATFVAGHEGIRTGGSIEVGPFDVSLGRRYRYTEYRLDPGEPVYVAGHARYAPSVEGVGQVKAIIGGPHDGTAGGSRIGRWVTGLVAFPFVVADGSERVGQRRLLQRGLLLFFMGAMFAVVPLLILFT